MNAPLAEKTRAGKRQAAVRAADLARGIDHALTPIDPVRDHLRRLREMGFSSSAIASVRGMTFRAVDEIVHGRFERMRGLGAHEWLHVTPQAIFQVAPAGSQVAAYAARRRVHALMAFGHSQATIGATALALTGTHARLAVLARDPRIDVVRHRAIAAAFTHLALTPGTSHIARKRALARGLVPPLAWDDIDDYDAVPTVGTHDHEADTIDPIAVELAVAGAHPRLYRAERVEATRILTERGHSISTIADLLDVDERSVSRYRGELRQHKEDAA